MGAEAAVVLDIEGTTGSLEHVRDVLFPFARSRMPNWFAANRGSPPWNEVLSEMRAHLDAPDLDEKRALAILARWSDEDVKAPPLKHLQGLIWASGYADGTLHGHVYDEVPAVLAQWHSRAVQIFIYSSGSAKAQRDWFAHTSHGDLTRYLAGYFDLDNAGVKTATSSYLTISAAIGTPPARTWFFSDVAGELTAAAAAGWSTVAVRRRGDERGRVAGHRTVDRLNASLICTSSGDWDDFRGWDNDDQRIG